MVCGRTERSPDSFHRLQDECSPGSGQTVAGKLNQILGFDLRLRKRLEPLVSEEVCRGCWSRVTETVDLELRLQEIKEAVVASFFNTAARFQNAKEAPQQERFIKQEQERSIKQEQQRSWENKQQRYMEEEQRSLEQEERRSLEQNRRRSIEQERRRSMEQEQQRSTLQERRRSIEQERRRSIEQEQRKSIEQERRKSIEQERRMSLKWLSEQHEQQEVFIKREPEQSNPSLPYPSHFIPMGYTQHMMFPSLLPNNQVSEINPLSLLALYPGFRFHQTRDEERITELPMEASEPIHYSPAPTAESRSSSVGARTDEICPKPDQRTEEDRSKSPKESGYNSSGSVSASSDSPSSVSENESSSSSSSRSYTHEEDEKRKPMKKRKRAQETDTQSYKRLNSE